MRWVLALGAIVVGCSEAKAPETPPSRQEPTSAGIPPVSPEIGAGARDAQFTCEQQGARYKQEGSEAVCARDGAPVFGVMLDGDRVSAVSTYYEGSNLMPTMRQIAEAKYGPAREQLTNGARVLSWQNGAITLRMYSRGVVLLQSPVH